MCAPLYPAKSGATPACLIVYVYAAKMTIKFDFDFVFDKHRLIHDIKEILQCSNTPNTSNLISAASVEQHTVDDHGQ